MTEKALLILNGPGLADPGVGGDSYGNITLEQIHGECAALCENSGISLEFRQTEDEDEILRWIATDADGYDALIINPVSNAKAGTVDLKKVESTITKIARPGKPIVEVRLTNIFRDGAELTGPLQGPEGTMGFVCGLGLHSYLFGITAIAKRLQS